jgi:argonaute-like protein implicated in RNA metabolism and viral defense
MDSFRADNAIPLPDDSLGSYLEALEDVQARDDDFALVFTSNKMHELGHRSPYWAVKAVLTEAGVPSQMVMIDRLRSRSPHHRQLKNLIVNIANQIYAKLGGTPWVVHRPDSPVDLIIGVGKSVYQKGRIGDTQTTLGFASAYQSNGAFLWYDSTEATISDLSFYEQLFDAIVSTVRECAQREGSPKNVIIHTYKRIGPAERQVKHHLEDEYEDVEVTLAHLNDSHNYRIYDDKHQSGLSQRGLCIRTGENKGFVMTGGRRSYRPGSATPIDMTVKGNASIETTAQGVFDLCNVYWKDQFGASMPITIKYSEDIADIFENAQRMNDEGLINVDIDQMVNPQLKRVPWFV